MGDELDDRGDRVRVRVVASGGVQGVWYRQSCLEQARAAGVAGWVRNHPDGTVEAELEGTAGAVEAVVAWMRVGPPRATVTGLAVEDLAPVGVHGFEVR